MKISTLKKRMGKGEQDDGGVGGHGVHLSPQIHQKYTFRHTSSEPTGVPDQQKRIYRPTQNLVG